jgi:alpha-tubulin suppressor-like RCC1 family protein
MSKIQKLCFYPATVLLLAVLVTACGSDSSFSQNQTTISSSKNPNIYYAHNIAFRNHTAMTWGYNGYGQLGNGANITSATPTAVPGLVGVLGGEVGGTHTVVFQNISGRVWTWGNNAFGQLGDGTINAVGAPVSVPGITRISGVAAGGNHTLALSEDAGGRVWAWGQNFYGQLGNGDNIGLNQLVPVEVLESANGSSLTGVAAIAAGGSHSLALTSDGKVQAWGYNDFGQLGQQGESRTTDSSSPLLVMSNYSSTRPLTGITMIKAGGSHNVALKTDGTVWAWGYNGLGQLGTDSTNTIEPVTGKSFSTVPIEVKEIIGKVVAVAAGLGHTLALTDLADGGIVWAWGFNGLGQLGNNTTIDSATPVKVKVLGADGKTASELTDIKRIFAVGHHNYAVRNDGTVWAWGNNTTLQLGISNSSRFSMVALKVPDFTLPIPP